MPYQYSQQLITDYQEYFLERFNKEISVSQANEYLHSMAGLFLWLNGKNGRLVFTF